MSRDRPESRPARPHLLSRLSFRRKLALIVGVPSLIALLGSVLTLERMASAYNRARVLEKANASSSHLIQAAAAQAKERGFTAAALSDPNADTTRRSIDDLRVQGDRLLDAALLDARPALRGNEVLAAALDGLRKARHARNLARQVVDDALLHEKVTDQQLVQNWFDTQTHLIQAERVFGSTLFIAQNPYELVIQYNGSIKANVFVASEFAGRERARIGRFIASGQPIPPERLEELQRWRGVVEENIAAISQLRANPAMSAAVLQSIDRMEHVFLGDYQNVRVSIYAASARREPYPLSTDQWIAVSTRAIDSIIAVSDGIGEEAARISHQQTVFSLANVLLILGMLGLLGLAVIAAVFVARHLTRRLGELRAAAERMAMGVYSQPVSEASSAGAGGGEEFAELASAFNTMQARVEAGIEQLRAEKAGMEARVADRTRELSEANARLLALNSEKDTFLGICSHDLKNPLSGIVGLASLIQVDAGDAEAVRGHALEILHASEFMFHLVTNLLDIGAIEQGRFNLHPEPLALNTLVARGVESYRPRAAEKRIDLRLNLPTVEVTIHADARATRQIIDNLVSNAVKYTPPGGEVEVSVAAADGDTGLAGFAVRDTGPGLTVEDQARLFGKYTRLSPKATDGEHSAGLGLFIVKQLVAAMGGTVGCVSAPGRGSTFAAEFVAEGFAS